MPNNIINYLNEIMPNGGNSNGHAEATVENNGGLSVGTLSLQNFQFVNTQVVANPITYSPVLTTTPVATTSLHTQLAVASSYQRIETINRPWLIDKTLFVDAIRVIEPVQVSAEPIVVGKYLVFPSPEKKRLYFLLKKPKLVDFSMTVIKEDVNDTRMITGGTAEIILDVYHPDSLTELEALRNKSNSPLGQYKKWKFIPLTLKGLDASLENYSDFDIEEVNIVTSDVSGTIAYSIVLTSAGATNWENAIRENQEGVFHGICKIIAKIFAKDDDGMKTKEIDLIVSLNKLLKNVSTNDVTVIDPVTHLKAHIVVVGHPEVETITINWQPSEGSPPVSEIYGPEGGIFEKVISGTDLEDLTIDISYEVVFTNSRWPVIRKQQTLSFADNNWSDTIKPSSWIKRYLLMANFVDENGEVVNTQSGDNGENPETVVNMIHCVLSYTADYLDNNVIAADIDPNPSEIKEVLFPLPEEETPGDLKINVVAIHANVPSTGYLDIPEDSSMIHVKIPRSKPIEFEVLGGFQTESALLSSELNVMNSLFQ